LKCALGRQEMFDSTSLQSPSKNSPSSTAISHDQPHSSIEDWPSKMPFQGLSKPLPLRDTNASPFEPAALIWKK
jgi:hypothetical protein